MLISGVGVGLTLPTLMATAAGSLPPQSFATGSAVINVFRQVGLALGVALFIAVLGTPAAGEATREAFQAAWLVLAGVALAAALAGAVLLRPRRPGEQPAEPAAAGAPVA
jgi:hypothetical protein